MKDVTQVLVACCAISVFAVGGCKKGDTEPGKSDPVDVAGTVHGPDDGHDHGEPGHSADDHNEVPIGTMHFGDMKVECAQGHGDVAPGKEMHLVLKLPYSDNGGTVVRVWIGTEDRLGSRVAKGTYAAAHDDYDVHAIAPDPLPEGAKWWVELERPDGKTEVSSIAFR